MWSIFVKGINVFLLRTAINESNNIYSVYATQSAGNKKKSANQTYRAEFAIFWVNEK